MASNQNKALDGKRIAELMTDGVEQIEYTGPTNFLREQGAIVTLVAPKAQGQQVQGMNHTTPGDRFTVDIDVHEARAGEYDGLLLPGGVANPDALRLNREAVRFVRAFADADKPIAAICHGPWTLIDAEAVSGKHMTSWPSLQTDLRNGGALWSDEQVVVDGKLVTSRKPDDIPAFNDAFLEALMQAAPTKGEIH